jgi:outer membrane protein assembly factor BamB
MNRSTRVALRAVLLLVLSVVVVRPAMAAAPAGKTVITFKLVKPAAGMARKPPEVRLVSQGEAWTVHRGPSWSGENPREIFFTVETRDAKAALPTVEVTAEGVIPQRVIVGKQDVPFQHQGDRTTFTLVRDTRNAMLLNQVFPDTEGGLPIHVYHNWLIRQDGQYRGLPVPEVEVRAVLNYLVAAREALKLMGAGGGQKAFQGDITLMSFEVACARAHNDHPPHVHIMLWVPGYVGGEIPHFYMDAAGRIVRNSFGVLRDETGKRPELKTILEQKAKRGGEYGPGKPCGLYDLENRLALELTITAEGGLLLRQGSQSCLLIGDRQGPGEAVLVVRDGKPVVRAVVVDDAEHGHMQVTVEHLSDGRVTRTLRQSLDYDPFTGMASAGTAKSAKSSIHVDPLTPGPSPARGEGRKGAKASQTSGVTGEGRNAAKPKSERAWPQFRGPRGDGLAEADPPLAWSATEHVKWKMAVPGRGRSSPVVLGDRIWMTAAREQGVRRTRIESDDMQVAEHVRLGAVCLSAADGKLLFERELFDVDHPAPVHWLNSWATPTPVVDSGRLYCDFGAFGTACIDAMSGNVLWKCRLVVDHQVGPGSSPMVYRNRLILVRDGGDVQYVAALDVQTGAIAWKAARPPIVADRPNYKKAFSTPLLITAAGRTQLVVPAPQWFVAYDPESGKELWRVHHGKGFSIAARPVFGHGMVYVCTGAIRPELWAIRVDGQGDVTDTHVAWKTRAGIPVMSSPILVGDYLYSVSDAGIVSCWDARSGKVAWRERLEGNYLASPLCAGERLYFFNRDGLTTVLKTGEQFTRLAENRLEGPLVATPAMVEQSLFLRTDSHLYRIECP